MSNVDPSGHVALDTGSSRGLSLEMAKALGRAGAKVALNYYHNRETADRALERMRTPDHASAPPLALSPMQTPTTLLLALFDVVATLVLCNAPVFAYRKSRTNG